VSVSETFHFGRFGGFGVLVTIPKKNPAQELPKIQKKILFRSEGLLQYGILSSPTQKNPLKGSGVPLDLFEDEKLPETGVDKKRRRRDKKIDEFAHGKIELWAIS